MIECTLQIVNYHHVVSFLEKLNGGFILILEVLNPMVTIRVLQRYIVNNKKREI